MENLTPEKVEELIQGYLDMSLTNDQKVALERYVEINSNARRELEQYKKLLELMELQETLELPDTFTGEVMNKLPEVDFSDASKGYGSSTEKLLPAFKWVSMAVVAVLFVAIVNLDSPFFRSKNNQTPLVRGTVTAQASTGSNTQNASSDANGQTDSNTLNKEIQLAQKITLKVDGGVVHVKTREGFKIVNSGDTFLLNSFDEVRTGASSTASLYYPDDKIHLKLKPMSRVEVSQNQLRLFQGDSWVHVVKKGTRFEVKTSNLIAAVRGTVFSVSALPVNGTLATPDSLSIKSQVDVFEGVVEVRSITSVEPSQMVEAGESVSSDKLVLAKKGIVSERRYQDWYSENEETGKVETIVQPQDTSSDKVNSEINPTAAFDKDLR